MSRLPIVFLCCLVVSCKSSQVQPQVPALLANPGPESLQQIEQAVSAATGGAKVTLGSDVFTKSSVLVIERTVSRGIDRAMEPGRDTGRPYRFRLMQAGPECLLVEDQTGQYRALPGVECVGE